MRIINIAFKDVLITLKDRKALAMIVLMPIALIFVLGMSLSSMFGQGGFTMKKFDVAITDKDGGEYADHFIDFLKGKDISKMLNLKEMDEREDMDMVGGGKLAALIVLPEGYSKAVKEGKEAKISIYEDPGSPVRTKVVESLVKSYAGVGSAVQGAAAAADSVMRDYKLNGAMIIPEIVNLANEGRDSNITESNVENGKGITAIQYYSAAMLVMYILFVGMLGTSSLIEEREQKTLSRLMGTTVSRGTILGGKLLGTFILGVFDVVVLIIFTRLVFNVKWGKSLPGLLTLSAAMIFAACGFALFIATVFKTSKAVDSVSSVMVMVMGFVGGSMYPIGAMPPIMQTFAKVALNNWALRGYLNLMMNEGFNSILIPALALCIFGTAFLTAGITRLKLD